MQFIIDGHAVFGASGGRAYESGQPLALFVHGAGLDHTVWAYQSRWLAFHGWNVLALDLPGHGRSAGPLLPSIGAMAAWLAAMIVAAESKYTTLIGHSMGSLIALETASCLAERVTSLVLIGAAAAMPVHPELLAAAAANDHAAIDMVNLWGYGYAAGLGGSPAPGLWLCGLGERVLEQAQPGVLHNDLNACGAYLNGAAAAARVAAPTLLICGEHDHMTPLRNGRLLATTIAQATLVVVPGAGHMLLAERPYEVHSALAQHLAVNRSQVAGR